MFSFIICCMYLIPLVLCFVSGDVSPVSALMSGAGDAVSFCVSVAGGICLWSAVAELLEECGASEKLSGLLHPVLCRLFPKGSKVKGFSAAITENVSANILGLGNAATPAGIRAAKNLAEMGGAEDELCMLVVLNTASVQLIPTTVAAIRAAAGASAPFDILPAVWFSSACALAAGLVCAAFLRKLWR